MVCKISRSRGNKTNSKAIKLYKQTQLFKERPSTPKRKPSGNSCKVFF